MFRSLGLKHVFCVSEHGFLTGIITRHDLLRPQLEEDREKEAKKEEKGGFLAIVKEFSERKNS